MQEGNAGAILFHIVKMLDEPCYNLLPWWPYLTRLYILQSYEQQVLNCSETITDTRVKLKIKNILNYYMEKWVQLL